MTGAAPATRVPRYLQVSAALQQRIEAGDYPLGAQLPTEIELCEAFAVSRHTVRDALRRLADAGFLQRRQGSGSQVVSVTPHRAYVQSMRSLNELFQYAANTRFRIDRMEQTVPDATLGVSLDGAEAMPWLVVEGLRVDPTGERPICWSTVLINRAYAGVDSELTSHGGAIYRLIEQRFGVEVVDVEQEISAAPMPETAARAMAVSPKPWAVRVVRHYRDVAGGLMLVSVNHHSADRFSYTMHLRRDGRNWG